ncbi:MAG TPA: MFS transporter [Ktedonosporobacter sp.]|nr:MFS transporter [Ktedonosporobacter sp.]
MAIFIRQPCDEGIIHAAPDTATCSRDVGRWVLIATILGSSMVIVDGTAVNVALPILQKNLGASVSELQWIVEAYALFLSALTLLGGSLGDLFGRKRIFGIGVALFALASMACGLAQNAPLLILARAVQGIGGALMIPGSLAIISTTFSKEQRAQAVGTWSGFTVISGAVGPVLGGWLVENASWRAVFFLNVPLAVVVLATLYWRVPESHDEENAKLDWRGALLIVIGLGALVYGLIASGDLGLLHPLVLLSLVIGLGALWLFLLWEARSQEPMVPLTLFRSRTFSGANIITLLLYSAFGGVMFFFPFNLIQVQGYSALTAGLALLPIVLIVAASSRWTAGLVNHIGPKTPLVVGPLLMAAGLALYIRTGVGGSYWTTFFPAVLLQGIGAAITIAPLTTIVIGAVEARHAGLASGINNAVSRTALVLSVAVLSIVFLGVFSSTLQNRLASLSISPQTRQQIEAQQTRLAGIEIPAEVSAPVRVALTQNIDDAFVTSFRTVMTIAVGLALLSSLCAWLTIQTPQEEGREQGIMAASEKKSQEALT